jgi:hypothetical protein
MPPPSQELEEVAGADADPMVEDVDERTEEDLREEAALTAEAEDISRRLKEGLPMPEDEPDPVADLSAYQRHLKTVKKNPVPVEEFVPNWLRLARWSMSEGPKDAEALLQMARSIQRDGERIGDTIARRAPHVSRKKNAAAGRQLWTSTLVPGSTEPPPHWFECESIEKSEKTGKWLKLPKGCHGVWYPLMRNQWVAAQAHAKEIIDTSPKVIPGFVTDQGGEMDIWRIPELRPYLCYLGKAPWAVDSTRGNHFFGPRKHPMNKGKCKPISAARIASSKTISVSLMKQRGAFRKLKKKVGLKR